MKSLERERGKKPGQVHTLAFRHTNRAGEKVRRKSFLSVS